MRDAWLHVSLGKRSFALFFFLYGPLPRWDEDISTSNPITFKSLFINVPWTFMNCRRTQPDAKLGELRHGGSYCSPDCPDRVWPASISLSREEHSRSCYQASAILVHKIQLLWWASLPSHGLSSRACHKKNLDSLGLSKTATGLPSAFLGSIFGSIPTVPRTRIFVWPSSIRTLSLQRSTRQPSCCNSARINDVVFETITTFPVLFRFVEKAHRDVMNTAFVLFLWFFFKMIVRIIFATPITVQFSGVHWSIQADKPNL